MDNHGIKIKNRQPLARQKMQPAASQNNHAPLYDSFSRRINYLRLAVTEKCNLNCIYCRPTDSSQSKSELLTYEELLKIVQLFSQMGINKIRLTGGEPFARKNFINLVRDITDISEIKNVSITTNGTLCFDHIKELKQIGITGLNFSLDTLSPQRYKQLTGAPLFHEAFSSVMEAVVQGLRVKINVVVLDGHNIDELLHIAALAENFPIDVRFIEPMHFNGRIEFSASPWDMSQLYSFFMENLPGSLETLPTGSSTTRLFTARNYQGKIGVIAGHSRTFCHTCNKVRVTPQGIMKNCLYDQGVFDLKEMLRRNCSDEKIKTAIRSSVFQKPADGRQAALSNESHDNCSMARIGG